MFSHKWVERTTQYVTALVSQKSAGTAAHPTHVSMCTKSLIELLVQIYKITELNQSPLVWDPFVILFPPTPNFIVAYKEHFHRPAKDREPVECSCCFEPTTEYYECKNCKDRKGMCSPCFSNWYWSKSNRFSEASAPCPTCRAPIAMSRFRSLPPSASDNDVIRQSTAVCDDVKLEKMMNTRSDPEMIIPSPVAPSSLQADFEDE